MTKLQYINLNAKSYTLKQKLYNVGQCLVIAALFLSPAVAYMLD